jgi:cell division protein FtsQ
MGYVRNGKLPALLLLLGAGWLLYATLTSPRYVVQQVRLEGGHALTQADVATLVNVQGTPIWSVAAEDVESRVAQSPYVERVSARVVLPATVLVRVQERQPAMRWQSGDVVYDVAQDGRILAAAPNEASPLPDLIASDVATETTVLSPAGVLSPTTSVSPQSSIVNSNSVVIVDTTPDRTLQPGEYVDGDALEVARRVALRAAEFPAPLEQITWEQNIGVVLRVGGKTVVIGNSERLDEKLAIFGKVVREQTPFSLLDLRPTAPYLR